MKSNYSIIFHHRKLVSYSKYIQFIGFIILISILMSLKLFIRSKKFFLFIFPIRLLFQFFISSLSMFVFCFQFIARKQCSTSCRRIFGTTASTQQINDQIDDIRFGWANSCNGKHTLFTSCQKWYIFCTRQCIKFYFMVQVRFTTSIKY